MNSKDAALLYQRAGFTAPRSIATPDANKFNATKKMVDGILFDSTGEATCYQLLKSWESSGAISNLELQPAFVLVPKSIIQRRAVKYVADFRFDRHGKSVTVDYKGMLTPVFKVKRSMLMFRYPDLNFEVWTRETLKELQ